MSTTLNKNKRHEKKSKKDNVIILDPPESLCWRYECEDGAINIYVQNEKDMTRERALWLLHAAIRDLVKVYE